MFVYNFYPKTYAAEMLLPLSCCHKKQLKVIKTCFVQLSGPCRFVHLLYKNHRSSSNMCSKNKCCMQGLFDTPGMGIGGYYIFKILYIYIYISYCLYVFYPYSTVYGNKKLCINPN